MADRASGCLGESDMQVLRDAAPGTAPDALAHHVAGCRRCQERLLFGAERPPRAATRNDTLWPSARRLAFLVLCLIGMIALFVWSLQKLLNG
jgi:hypothetical protein